MNKLGANMHCIVTAEEKYSSMEEEDSPQDLDKGHEAGVGIPGLVHMGDGS